MGTSTTKHTFAIKFNILITFFILCNIFLPCDGFASRGFGQSNKGNGLNKKGRSNKKKYVLEEELSQIQTIELGPGKSVKILIPPNKLENEIAKKDITKFASTSRKKRSKLLQEFGTYRGSGDVIWPSSLHLSRLIANCPSFVDNRRVIDIGCGLGLASLATLLGNPSRLVLSDVDKHVLDHAMQSCTQMIQTDNVSNLKEIEQMQIDWFDKSTWPDERGTFDTILASDVLYDEEAAVNLSALIAHFLLPSSANTEDGRLVSGRALIVDPSNRLHRDIFQMNAAKNGLHAETVPFPGQEQDFVLINVTPIME